MAIGDCIKNCPGCPDKKTLKVVIPNFDLPALSVFSSFLAAVLRGWAWRKTREKQNSVENAQAWRPEEISVHQEQRTIPIKNKDRDIGA